MVKSFNESPNTQRDVDETHRRQSGRISGAGGGRRLHATGKKRVQTQINEVKDVDNLNFLCFLTILINAFYFFVILS